MNIQNPFKLLNKFEMCLWLTSLFVVLLSYVLSGFEGTANTLCSLIGVTALIFVAKGHVLGMVLCIVFAAFYGLISLHFRYYGELITYAGMTLPMVQLFGKEPGNLFYNSSDEDFLAYYECDER